MMPQVAGLASRLEAACILVNLDRVDLAADEEVYSHNLGTIDFELNVSGSGSQVFQRSSANSPDFWVAYILGAFQGPTQSDFDPSTEAATRGISSRNGAVIYRETIRDHHEGTTYTISEPELWEAAAIHEIGHALGIANGNDSMPPGVNEHDVLVGTIMNYSSIEQLPFSELVFGRIAFRLFAELTMPGESLDE
jgi:hypothetical protein